MIFKGNALHEQQEEMDNATNQGGRPGIQRGMWMGERKSRGRHLAMRSG